MADHCPDCAWSKDGYICSKMCEPCWAKTSFLRSRGWTESCLYDEYWNPPRNSQLPLARAAKVYSLEEAHWIQRMLDVVEAARALDHTFATKPGIHLETVLVLRDKLKMLPETDR